MKHLSAILIFILVLMNLYGCYSKSSELIELKLYAFRENNNFVIKVSTNLGDGVLIRYEVEGIKDGWGYIPIKNRMGEVKIENVSERTYDDRKEGYFTVKVRFEPFVMNPSQQPKWLAEKYGYFNEKLNGMEKTGDTSIGYLKEEQGIKVIEASTTIE